MKLYKDGKCMQMVDKDQLEICLEAGWSRTDFVAEEKAKEAKEQAELQALEDAEALLANAENAENADEEEDPIDESSEEASAPKKIVRKPKKR